MSTAARRPLGHGRADLPVPPAHAAERAAAGDWILDPAPAPGGELPVQRLARRRLGPGPAGPGELDGSSGWTS
ncbi:hypothetical protein ABT272_43850 [Streptomyces sp900105245]|uniref:Uncharacterized protein n=1 Tax=Streptomyces sp. 900105245 TaxID=3154379 RepID=A0ABV1UMG4_9ACTN